MSVITWLHISDIHFCPQKTGWDSDRIITSLQNDLSTLQKSMGVRPDIIFVTGDLVYGQIPGSPITDQYDDVGRLLEAIRKCFSPSIPIKDIFIVPGNHDVNRQSVTPDQTEWLDRQGNKDTVNDLISHAEIQWRRYMERLDDYKDFLNRFGYTHLLDDTKRLVYNAMKTIDGISVGIAGMNSVWSSSRNGEKGKLWFGGEWQVGTLFPKIRNCDIKIAISHHPMNWTVEYEDEILHRRLQQDFDFYLHGHEHQGWVNEGDSHVRIAAAALYDRSNRTNGYNITKVDTDSGDCSIWLREYDSSGGGWVKRPIAGKAENGIWELKSCGWLKKNVSKKTEIKQNKLLEEKLYGRDSKQNFKNHEPIKKFGSFVALEELGRGSFGTVYLARHKSSKALIAIKQFNSERFGKTIQEEAYQRFLRGYRIMQHLSHPGIVNVFDLHDNGIKDCYFTMEYHELGGLQQYVKITRENLTSFELAEKIDIVISLCETVSYAHSRDVIHRDIKPNNVLISKDPISRKLYAKLSDFDLAFQRGDTGLTYGPMGSLFFLPPEVRNDLSRQNDESLTSFIPSISSRAEKIDIYAIGGVLYYLITNCYPPLSDVRATIDYEYERVRSKFTISHNQLVLDALFSILHNILSVKPEFRPTSVSALREEIVQATINPGNIIHLHGRKQNLLIDSVSDDLRYKYFPNPSRYTLQEMIVKGQMSCAVIQDHNIKYASPEFLKLTILPIPDFIANPILNVSSFNSGDLFSLSDLEDIVLKSDQHEIIQEIDVLINRNVTKNCKLRVSPIKWNSRPAIFITIEDVSESMKFRNQLIQSQKMEAIGTLAGGIAHDFNNILASISGYTELAIETQTDGSQSKEYLLEALNAGKRARDLVRQILTFSRLQDDEFKPVKVQVIARDALRLLRSTVPTTIEIRTEINQDCPAVLANPTQLHQVIMNVCINAFQAMSDSGGVLTVKIDEFDVNEKAEFLNFDYGRYVRISIRDTGVGMDSDVMDRLFEPYFTTKEPGKGTGLGLSVVHGIIKSLKGEISVESQVNQGSVFNISIPAYMENKKEDSYKSETLHGSEQILIIDDEESLVKLYKTGLEKFGYTIFSYTDSIEAISNFKTLIEKFDCVITDQTMPKMTGIEVGKEILKLRPDIPIIITTGYSEQITEDIVLSIGIKKILRKPFSVTTLAKTIRKILN